MVTPQGGILPPAPPSPPINKDPNSLVPSLRTKLLRFQADMRMEGTPFRIDECKRSKERQQYLFDQGRKFAGPIVTWTLDSNHLDAEAADIYPEGFKYQGLSASDARAVQSRFDFYNSKASEYGLVFPLRHKKDWGHIEEMK